MDIGFSPVEHETAIRFAAFALAFALMAAWEVAAPRRALALPKGRRWLANLGVTLLNAGLVRVLFPAATVGVALAAGERRWGLFNVLPVPAPLAFAVSFLALDLVIWIQHVAFHRVPLLARLHRMH
ncbi:MAG: sterol desaturase family protein, partial [Terriglobales bacterium]